uniref:CHK kinase-like domain-containing protein n=1 Tax=Timema cristinae TaxID=61476 RepID=A0A7R9DEN5_TIMCR|nr:unnamed protein product [Timema cristinae]
MHPKPLIFPRIMSRRFADNLMENLERVLKRDDEGFNVLNHGDLWVNNLMFRYDDATGDVREVRFLDFQNVQFTSPAIDLQYFLVVSPDADVRAHHCDRLLEEYQEELSLLLTALGYPRRIPSLSDLKEEIERKAFHGLFAAVTDLAILLSEDGFEYDSTLQGGGNSVFSSRKYRDVMYKLLPIFEEKGVI